MVSYCCRTLWRKPRTRLPKSLQFQTWMMHLNMIRHLDRFYNLHCLIIHVNMYTGQMYRLIFTHVQATNGGDDLGNARSGSSSDSCPPAQACPEAKTTPEVVSQQVGASCFKVQSLTSLHFFQRNIPRLRTIPRRTCRRSRKSGGSFLTFGSRRLHRARPVLVSCNLLLKLSKTFMTSAVAKLSRHLG